jgi:hypothetical protein
VSIHSSNASCATVKEIDMKILDIQRRNFVGYGKQPPKVVWPGNKKIAISFVVNYEEVSISYVYAGYLRRITS